MRAVALALGLACAVAGAGCKEPLTWVQVRVDNIDLAVPDDIATVRLTVTNPDVGATTYQSPELRLCGGAVTSGCASFPITVTLRPGSERPSAPVRVQVDAFRPDGTAVISNASQFTFSPGVQQSLDLPLWKGCLGTACASGNQACVQAGYCTSVAPTGGAVDMASPGPVTRISVQPDCANGNGRQSLPVPPPDAQPGDLVLVGVYAPNFLADGAPPGWQSLGSPDGFSRVLWRVAGAGEAQATALYQLPVRDPGFDSTGCWDVIVYRNARSVRAVASVQAPPYQLPPIAGVPAGATVLGLLAGDRPGCNPTAGVGAIAGSAGWVVLEATPTNGALPALDLDCATVAGGDVGALFELLLVP